MAKEPALNIRRTIARVGSLARRQIGAFGFRAAAPEVLATRPIPLPEGEIVARAQTLPGWLNTPASLVTMHLLSILPEGPAMEIGVYRGKYLFVIRACLGPSCRIVGYDIFHDLQQGRVLADFETLLSEPSNLRLVVVDSTRLTPSVVLKDCGTAPVFVSIDGSHEAGPVLSDLTLADQVLDEAGIVAVDDALNPLTLGVVEGLGRFFIAKPNMVPFLYAANKLFLCRPSHLATYQSSVMAYLDGRGEDPSFKVFRDLKLNRDGVTRNFFGAKVIIAA